MPKDPKPQLLLDHRRDPHQDRTQALNVCDNTEAVRVVFPPHEGIFQTHHISLQGHEQYQTAKVSLLMDQTIESATHCTKTVEGTNDCSLEDQEQMKGQF